MTPHEIRPSVAALMGLGVITGLLSGFFGIGGGIVLVPLLVLVLGFAQRLAVGTSVAAILPAGVVGGLGYAIQGNVDWVAALCLALGMVVGAQLGSYLLSRLPTTVLRVLLMVFLLAVAVSLWFVVPQRDDAISMSLLTAVLLVCTGLLTGAVSGLLGVGGGVIVVPVLMFFFGANDLDAKGTSLIMLIPGSISGTLGNVRRRTVDLRSAAILGVVAGIFAPVGSIVAPMVEPFWSNAAFSALLVVVLIQMAMKMLPREKKD